MRAAGFGTTVLHRYGVAGTDYFVNVNDSAVPSVNSGLNLSRYVYAKVDSVVSGDGVSWDIVPLLGSPDGVNYVSGDKISIVGNVSDVIASPGVSDFYVMVRNSGGTNPGIKVYVTGYNV